MADGGVLTGGPWKRKSAAGKMLESSGGARAGSRERGGKETVRKRLLLLEQGSGIGKLGAREGVRWRFRANSSVVQTKNHSDFLDSSSASFPSPLLSTTPESGSPEKGWKHKHSCLVLWAINCTTLVV